MTSKNNTVFENESVFRRKLKAYIKYCTKEDAKRLPNVAGFCRFCGIKRSDYAKLREVYPLAYDIAESTFIDEALNTKVLNSGAIMSFISEFNTSVCNSAESSQKSKIEVVCSHDSFGDGE